MIGISAGQGYVHRLDGGRDQRQSASFGAAYMRQDAQGNAPLQGLVRYEWAQDRG